MNFITTITDYLSKSILSVLGDLLTFTATGVKRLASGTAYKVLRSTGVGTVLAWVNNDVAHTDSGIATKTKLIEIVNWNMNSTAMVNIAHGLSFQDIVDVTGVIIDDNITLKSIIGAYNGTGPDTAELAFNSVTSSVVNVERLNGGYFDSTDYDSVGGFVRGYILITYKI